MDRIPAKSTLIALLEQAHAQHEALLHELPEEERAAIGTPTRWSAKDVVAHSAAWKWRLDARLSGEDRALAAPDADDVDLLNARTYELQRERAWRDILDDDRRATEALVARVHAIADDGLAATDRFAWQRGRPLWLRIAGVGWWHPQAHLAQWYVDRGDVRRGTEMREALAEAEIAADGTPTARGTALYNLACFYATTGQAAKAIAALREALELHPELVEASQQDPDLISLHDAPAFAALYER